MNNEMEDKDSPSDEESFSDSDDEEDSIKTAVKVKDLLADGISRRKIPVESLNKYITSYISLDMEHRSVQSQTKHHLMELSKLYKVAMNHKNNEIIFRKKLEELFKGIDVKKNTVQSKVEHLSDLMSTLEERNQRINDLREDIENKRLEYEELREKAEAEGKPIIEKYKKERENLESTIDRLGQVIGMEEQKREHFHEEISSLKLGLVEIGELIEKEKLLFETLRVDTYREKNQFLGIKSEFNAQHQKLFELDEIVKSLEFEESELKLTNKSSEEILKSIANKIESHTKQRIDLEKEIERYGITKTNEDKYNTQLIRMEQIFSKSLQECRSFIENQNDRIRRILEKIHQKRRDLASRKRKLVFLEASNIEFQKEVERINGTLKTLNSENSDVLKDVKKIGINVDMAINKFLNKEKKKEEMFEKFVETTQNVIILEDRVDCLKKDERIQIDEKRKFERERDLIFKELTKKKTKFVKIVGSLKQLKFQHVELRKKSNEIRKENIELHKKYERIQKERNTYVKEISQSRSILEQKRLNLKLLENEQKVFKRSVEEKNRMKRGIRNENKSLKDKISKQTFRVNDESLQVKQINKSITDHENEAKKITSCITLAEGDMSESKGKLEIHINERNLIGSQLIDKSDELAIIHEKYNQQKILLSEGERKLSNLEIQEKTLQNQLQEISTHLEAKLKKIPVIKQQVIEREQLIDEIAICEDNIIDLKVEDPKKRKIVKLMLKKSFDPLKIKEETKLMKKKLENVRDQIHEKKMFLKDLNSSVQKLEDFCTIGKKRTFKVAEEINELTVSLEKERRENQSLHAELSVYKAQLLEFRAKNRGIKKYIIDLKRKKNPPVEVKRELEKKIERKEKSKYFLNQENKLDRRNGPIQRPDSYLIDGIPQYYMFHPVMGSGESAQLRHYKGK